MKKLFCSAFLSFTLTLLLTNCTSNSKDNRIIGEWIADTSLLHKQASFTFKDNGYVSFNMNNVIYEGDGSQINGKTFKFKYDINADKTPIELTVNALEQGGDNTKEVFANCIIKFVTDKEMEMMANWEGQKFATFDPSDKGHYMKLSKK